MTDSKADAAPARGNWFKDFAIPAITVVTPLLLGGVGYWLSASQDDLKEQIAAVDVQVKLLEEKRRERESVQDFNITVLTEIKEALQSNNQAHKRVVIFLVRSLGDKDLAENWLNILLEEAELSTENRATAETALKTVNFEREQQQVGQRAVEQATLKPFDWEDYDYDVFYCEASPPQAREIAEQIVARMLEQDARGRLRVRPLPVAVNARPGYGISGFAIRRNADETKQADALKNIGDSVIGDTGSFVIGTSNQPTPYYLSAFVCPAADE